MALPSRPPLGHMRNDLFGVPPKPKAKKKVEVAAPPPAPPAAPAFPYKYAGRFTEGAEAPRTYLQKDNQLVEIKRNDVLDGVWRIDRLTVDGIEVSFVPGGQQLSMTFESLTGSEASKQTAIANATPTRSELAVQAFPAGSEPGRAPGQQGAPNAPQVIGGVGLASAPSAPSPSGARSSAGGQRMTSPASTLALQNSQNAPAGPGSTTPPPSGILGAEAPKSGSMPTGPAPSGTSMQIGPPPVGTMPSSPPPSGKLGL